MSTVCDEMHLIVVLLIYISTSVEVLIRGNQNSSIWTKRVRLILYIWQTKTCIQTGIYRHETAEQRLFPRCVVYLRLSCSSWALFKKLLKITNYPSLAVYRTIPKPLRMPVVLTLTETTHVTQSKSSFFHPSLFFSLSVFCLIWSMCLYVSASTSVSLFFMSACLSNQRETSIVWALALIDGRLGA